MVNTDPCFTAHSFAAERSFSRGWACSAGSPVLKLLNEVRTVLDLNSSSLVTDFTLPSPSFLGQLWPSWEWFVAKKNASPPTSTEPGPSTKSWTWPFVLFMLQFSAVYLCLCRIFHEISAFPLRGLSLSWNEEPGLMELCGHSIAFQPWDSGSHSLAPSIVSLTLPNTPRKKEHKQKKQYFNKFGKDFQNGSHAKKSFKKIQTMHWYEFFSHINSGNSNHTPMR